MYRPLPDQQIPKPAEAQNASTTTSCFPTFTAAQSHGHLFATLPVVHRVDGSRSLEYRSNQEFSLRSLMRSSYAHNDDRLVKTSLARIRKDNDIRIPIG